MYYSKNGSPRVSVPLNYGGNAFRVIDESVREPSREIHQSQDILRANPDCEVSRICEENECNEHEDISKAALSSILSGISIEDILLLGLILVIHQNDHNDPTLLLLLILLLSK